MSLVGRKEGNVVGIFVGLNVGGVVFGVWALDPSAKDVGAKEGKVEQKNVYRTDCERVCNGDTDFFFPI